MELVVPHELGHLVGLGHVQEPDELMFSPRSPTVRFPRRSRAGDQGDLQGLERLGADQGCLSHVRVGGSPTGQ